MPLDFAIQGINRAERSLTGRYSATLASYRLDARWNARAQEGRPVCVQFDCYDPSTVVWDRHFECSAGQAERTLHSCGINGRVAREGKGDRAEEYH